MGCGPSTQQRTPQEQGLNGSRGKPVEPVGPTAAAGTRDEASKTPSDADGVPGDLGTTASPDGSPTGPKRQRPRAVSIMRRDSFEDSDDDACAATRSSASLARTAHAHMDSDDDDTTDLPTVNSATLRPSPPKQRSGAASNGATLRRKQRDVTSVARGASVDSTSTLDATVKSQLAASPIRAATAADDDDHDDDGIDTSHIACLIDAPLTTSMVDDSSPQASPLACRMSPRLGRNLGASGGVTVTAGLPPAHSAYASDSDDDGSDGDQPSAFDLRVHRHRDPTANARGALGLTTDRRRAATERTRRLLVAAVM